jgi:hypothetical protein
MTTLYRAFDADGQLLYIGIADGPFLRLAKHAETAPWAVYARTITLEPYPHRFAAEEAEREAIATEDPVWNITGRPTRRYLQWMAAYPHGHPDDINVDGLLARVDPVLGRSPHGARDDDERERADDGGAAAEQQEPRETHQLDPFS